MCFKTHTARERVARSLVDVPTLILLKHQRGRCYPEQVSWVSGQNACEAGSGEIDQVIGCANAGKPQTNSTIRQIGFFSLYLNLEMNQNILARGKTIII